MQIPPYFLPRPALDLSPAKTQAFDRLFAEMNALPGRVIDYQLPYPKWQFLSYLGEMHPVLFHGSQNHAIEKLEPRQPRDIREFSNQLAVYASDDGIWSMYFAINDRQKYGMSLVNSCFRFQEAPGTLSDPFYFFSITASALAQSPWCTGMIYILPRANFIVEPPQQHHGIDIVLSHWVSPLPALPLARLPIGPQDFPFLGQIRGHDDALLFARAQADPDGFPWLDEHQA
jgi:hypothetical protein